MKTPLNESSIIIFMKIHPLVIVIFAVVISTQFPHINFMWFAIMAGILIEGLREQVPPHV